MEEYPLVRRDIFSGIPGREGERKGGSLPQREEGREGGKLNYRQEQITACSLPA